MTHFDLENPKFWPKNRNSDLIPKILTKKLQNFEKFDLKTKIVTLQPKFWLILTLRNQFFHIKRSFRWVTQYWWIIIIIYINVNGMKLLSEAHRSLVYFRMYHRHKDTDRHRSQRHLTPNTWTMKDFIWLFFFFRFFFP